MGFVFSVNVKIRPMMWMGLIFDVYVEIKLIYVEIMPRP